MLIAIWLSDYKSNRGTEEGRNLSPLAMINRSDHLINSPLPFHFRFPLIPLRNKRRLTTERNKTRLNPRTAEFTRLLLFLPLQQHDRFTCNPIIIKVTRTGPVITPCCVYTKNYNAIVIVIAWRRARRGKDTDCSRTRILITGWAFVLFFSLSKSLFLTENWSFLFYFILILTTFIYCTLYPCSQSPQILSFRSE